MAEAIDVFADTIRFNVAAYGCALHFAVSRPTLDLVPPGAPIPMDRVATVRLTPEFLKGIVFLLREHIVQYEKTAGAPITIPFEMLNQILQGTTLERWTRCWE